MECHAVRPPVVLRRERPLERGRDPEDAPVRNVGDEQIAGAIERGALEEAVDLAAGLVRVAPLGAALAPKGIRKAREHPRLDHLRRREGEIPHGRDSNRPTRASRPRRARARSRAPSPRARSSRTPRATRRRAPPPPAGSCRPAGNPPTLSPSPRGSAGSLPSRSL